MAEAIEDMAGELPAVLLAGVVAFLGAVPKPAKALLMRLVAALGFGVDAVELVEDEEETGAAPPAD